MAVDNRQTTDSYRSIIPCLNFCLSFIPRGDTHSFGTVPVVIERLKINVVKFDYLCKKYKSPKQIFRKILCIFRIFKNLRCQP